MLQARLYIGLYPREITYLILGCQRVLVIDGGVKVNIWPLFCTKSFLRLAVKFVLLLGLESALQNQLLVLTFLDNK